MIAGFTIIIITSKKYDNKNNKDELIIEGIVAKIEENHILVVEGLTNEEIINLTEREIIMTAESSTYIEFKEEFKRIEVGDKVKVFIESLDTSSPAYGVSNKIEILD